MSENRYLRICHEFAPAAGKSYIQIPFEVFPDTEYIIITGHYTLDQHGEQGSVDIGLADAEQQIRGWSGNLNRLEQIILGEEQASYGYLAGALQPGIWNILLGDSRPHSGSIVVELQLEQVPCHFRIIRGDIHGHSLYSDGAHSIETKLYMADKIGLDFLAFTDHNSVSQNFCLPTHSAVLMLPSCEITTYNGHVNIFDYRERRIPNFMCHSSEEVRQVLTELKEQGVRVQLNHPIRMGDIAGCQWNWDYDMPFDWIEIWNGHWNSNSIANVRMWQDFLEQGRFLPAVANSDFHSANLKQQGYPCNNVWVGKKTRKEIYDALAKGHNYVTAEPCPQRNFAARCLLASSKEFVPFGQTVRQGASLLLELSVAKAYLAEQHFPLIFRAWNESGLYLEMELQASHFKKCEEVGGHNHKFCLELHGGNIQATDSRLCFLRFELLECKAETALLLSNPIFWD